MTAKEYLNRPWKLNNEINDKLEKAARLRKDLYGRGVSYENNGGSGANGSNDIIGKAIAKIVDFEHEADIMIDELVTLKIDMEHPISLISDFRYRKILERRYLFFESFKAIASLLGYSEKHIYRLHSEAINALEKILRTNATKCE